MKIQNKEKHKQNMLTQNVDTYRVSQNYFRATMSTVKGKTDQENKWKSEKLKHKGKRPQIETRKNSISGELVRSAVRR